MPVRDYSTASKKMLWRSCLLLFAGGTLIAGDVLTGQTAASAVNLTSYPSSTSTSLAAAGRLLDQASFGPTINSIYNVEALGVPGYIDQQLQMQPTLMPSTVPAGTYGIADCSSFWTCYPEAWWWELALFAPDQLRQRVAFSLSKIFVVSENGVDGRYMPYYYNVLMNDAFGNWQNLMSDIAYSPAMGTYLNSANSTAAVNGGHADENFARELMQLFSIGTVKLNQDGSLVLDGNGNPVPNYTPEIVQNFARRLQRADAASLLLVA